MFDLGIAPYEPVQHLQVQIREAAAAGQLPAVILLLEHEPVITMGRRAGPADLRTANHPSGVSLEVLRTERGGCATLHAPGQLVSYPIMPIPRKDLHRFAHDLEETLLVLLAGFGVRASRCDGHPGLYVTGRKIASLGLRCHRWVSSHGTSLNVDPDLSLFDRIVSCGEPHLQQTSMEALTGKSYDMGSIKAAYVEAFREVFGCQLLPARRLAYHELGTALGLNA